MITLGSGCGSVGRAVRGSNPVIGNNSQLCIEKTKIKKKIDCICSLLDQINRIIKSILSQGFANDIIKQNLIKLLNRVSKTRFVRINNFQLNSWLIKMVQYLRQRRLPEGRPSKV